MSPISIISLSSESKLFSISLSASKERLSVADVGGRYQAITKNACAKELCHFFTLKTTQHPEYLFSRTPPERKITDNMQNSRAYPEKGPRTAHFSSTCFSKM